LDPARAPLLARYPTPADVVVVHPAAIVIGRPPPLRFLVARHPVPTPIVGVDPAANRVRTPLTRAVRRHPHVAPSGMALPATIWRQGRTEVRPNLGPIAVHRTARTRSETLMLHCRSGQPMRLRIGRARNHQRDRCATNDDAAPQSSGPDI